MEGEQAGDLADIVRAGGAAAAGGGGGSGSCGVPSTVENHVVGAPCGVMDQMTSACGEANKILAMVCQTFKALLEAANTDEQLSALGELMYQPSEQERD
ncbi:hypothetical protein E2562_022554 [Oryza meyeriana var. granulata]|uniref:Uncharacterized protein n=1 Tax=Oryza meyeriana var. granulata TaxID=110450 RepID=A0A6G1FAW2_9ORYZ|nr:hypothetical protein E2562_022554 [Oryza meyeriana var. granulata]